MATIKPKHLLFDVPDDMLDVIGFVVYYCPASLGPITPQTPYKFFPLVAGKTTYDILIPGDIPVVSGDTLLGVATVLDVDGTFSDIETIEFNFKLTPPKPPKNLRIL